MTMNENQQPLHHFAADLESIPNQIGHVILNKDGLPIHPPSGSLSKHDVDILYQILLEVGEIMVGGESNGNGNSNVNIRSNNEKLKMLTIEGGSGVSYSICVTKDGYLYVVKRRSSW